MPRFSIILPTFNRRDVLPRAIRSVLDQTFADWELLVIDDGSTDDTAALFDAFPQRVRYMRQANAGCYVARNEGLRQASGELITFLDSDDAWTPRHLELVDLFFRHHEGADLLMTEFWADYGDGHRIRNDRDLFANRWPRMAKRIGSTSLDLPANETDPYLRVFESGSRMGEWGRQVAADLGYPEAKQYSGWIADAYRWGYIGWLPAMTMTRRAFSKVGPFREDLRNSSDYEYLLRLCRSFEANVVGVPTAIKFETNGELALREDHLASGRNEYLFARNRILLFEEAFAERFGQDDELRRIAGLYEAYAGQTALEMGMRKEAIVHFANVNRYLPSLAGARAALLLSRFVPVDAWASLIYRAWRRGFRFFARRLQG